MRAWVVTPRVPSLQVIGMSLVLAACGGGADREATQGVSSAIIDGTEIDTPNSPVLFMNGSGVYCSAILIGPKLVATARHCVASLTEGDVICTPAGDLDPHSPGGNLGADFSPSSLTFFASTRVTAGIGGGVPDAVGAQIFSTGASTACRDDIAFVVLDRVIAGIVPASVRLYAPTPSGEQVSLMGYGLTDESGAQTALREHEDALIIAVGPSVPVVLQQPAPVRAVRVGPGTWACNGDSGGPISSQATGAVIAIVSLGAQASPFGPYCPYSSESNTTGPRLAEYSALALLAFAATGDSPIPEFSEADANSSDDAAAESDVTSEADTDADGEYEGGPTAAVTGADATTGPDAGTNTTKAAIPPGASCAAAPAGNQKESAFGLGLSLVAIAVGAARQRRRRS